jgi:hypothetical protein
LGNVFNAIGGMPAESNEQIKYMARKIRSVQDRFVTAKDYETAGMLHPRVKYSTVLLRTYIGKNSSRMSNEYIDVYFDGIKNNVEIYELTDSYTGEKLEHYLIVPPAYFTESTVPNMFDSIKFVETGVEYYFEIFDVEAIPANEWFKYPTNMIDKKSKGAVLKLTNKLISASIETLLSDKNKINNFLPFGFSISSVTFVGSTISTKTFDIRVSKDLKQSEVYSAFDTDKSTILEAYNLLVPQISFKDVGVVKTNKGFSVFLQYLTKSIDFPEKDLSFIWTHYKADDIYINPSKSNIIEIYVTGVRHDLKRSIEIYEPLSSSEINKLVGEIDKRKMISDFIQVYNSNVFEVEIAVRVYKSTKHGVTDEMLKSKIDAALDRFFNIANIPLGQHFYMSRMIEWLHTNIPEIQHIEMILHEDGELKGQPITPSSTTEIVMDRILFTQIVEKQQLLNGVSVPKRRIDILS